MLPKRSAGIAAFLRAPRNLAIVGGGAVLVVILLVVAFNGGSKKPTSHGVVEKQKKSEPSPQVPAAKETPDPPQPATPDNTATPSGAAATDTPATDTPPAADGSDTTAKTETPSGAKTPPAATDPNAGKKTAPTLGGKQVVLEYDSQARDAAGAPNSAAKADQSAISKARTSYAAGNQRLFAGDADGAIRYYKQALGYYPAYVAGYRGLGLAYAQQGNKAQALQAFRTYLSSVPNAKDGGLIRKRISTLQSH